MKRYNVKIHYTSGTSSVFQVQCNSIKNLIEHIRHTYLEFSKDWAEFQCVPKAFPYDITFFAGVKIHKVKWR